MGPDLEGTKTAQTQDQEQKQEPEKELNMPEPIIDQENMATEITAQMEAIGETIGWGADESKSVRTITTDNKVNKILAEANMPDRPYIDSDALDTKLNSTNKKT